MFPLVRALPFSISRADVAVEQQLLSDKLEDRLKELIESSPVEVGDTSDLWDRDQRAVSLVVRQLMWGVERQAILRWGRVFMGSAWWSMQGPGAGTVPEAFGSSPVWAGKWNEAKCLVCFK